MRQTKTKCEICLDRKKCKIKDAYERLCCDNPRYPKNIGKTKKQFNMWATLNRPGEVSDTFRNY